MILVTNHTDTISIIIGSTTVQESNQKKKLLGVIIDLRNTFEEHISTLCQKVSNKLDALSRISYFMEENKMTVLNDSLYK